ncbi:hypothetical protein K402DRAFT_341270, partial [Aulographum hederae CBS 113979]
NDTRLVLPPMDKRTRKAFHELALAFRLASKSKGTGTKRYPIMIKTIATREWSNVVFKRSLRLAAQGMYPGLERMDKASKWARIAKDRKGKAKKAGGGGGGGGVTAGVTYRHGEVVGAAASELGSENRGYALLERMGWKQGTALGSETNKGIMQPVQQVVRTGRAGLG